MGVTVSSDFERTSLWRNSLGSSEQPAATERLRTAYKQLRKNVTQLVSQIAVALPDLTIHDSTHLDALWEMSSLIAGEQFPVNPLEGFVLGAAFLIHDAALCFEAYGGRSELRNTAEWRDAFAIAQRRNENGELEQLEKQADFAALRNLHASQAEKILSVAWTGPSQSALYLLDDRELREAYGNLIGKIAASHHWRIDDLVAKLPSQVNSISSLPADWRIDSVKLACVLRCADAAHIDDRRAPDFLFAIARRNGISRNHWLAQNWLSRLDTYSGDASGRTSIITSKQKFQKTDATAWWVAHDLIALLNKEISQSNKLLASKVPSIVFKINSVAGSASPLELVKFVEVEGWTPTATEVHISNVSGLVTSLGGENLYGPNRELEIALRELIQNARDSVVARKNFQDHNDGKIWISHFEKDGASYLEVADNGLGMSKDVLLGPLLDFGTSFWASELVKEEFPGLSSSGFRSVGKYGIGFYAVFMVADQVQVSSKRWDEGTKDTRTLEFTGSSVFRPTFIQNDVQGLAPSQSTRVRLRLKASQSNLSAIKIPSGLQGWPDVEISMRDFVSVLCVGLDLPVFVKEIGSGEFESANLLLTDETPLLEVGKWLSRLVHVGCVPAPRYKDLSDAVTHATPRMRELKDSKSSYGFAALSAKGSHIPFLASKTIGGLGQVSHRSSGSFVGYIEHSSRSAKREASDILAPVAVVQTWADNQIVLLNNAGAEPIEMCFACMSVADMGADPKNHFQILIDIEGKYFTANLENAIAFLRSHGILIAVSEYNYINGIVGGSYGPYVKYHPVKNSSFLSTKNQNNNDYPKNSLLGCLARGLAATGEELTLEQVGTEQSAFHGQVKVMKIAVRPKSTR